MTCILGVAKDNVVYMVGDSASVGGLDVSVVRQPKVFCRGEYVIGYTTSFRMGQLLQFMSLPEYESGELDEFMVTRFIPAVRTVFKDGGFAKVENVVEVGGVFLVGIAGKLFRIDSDFQVSERADGIDAVGCGADYALGAYWAMEGQLDIQPRMIRALEAATYFSGGVRPPYILEKVK